MTRQGNLFDVIVIGVGSMGASTCFELARRGFKTLGIDQFNLPHEKGSHTGQSRIIRKAYFEHPDYVPLLHKAYNNWKQLEELTGEQVYFQTGLLYNGPAENPVIKGTKQAAILHSLELKDTPDKYSQFRLTTGNVSLFEPDAGFLRPEKVITLYKEEAKKNDAVIHENEKVIGWKKKQGQLMVTTDKDSYYARKLVISAGAWSNKQIPQLNDQLKITRQLVAWVEPKNKKDFESENFPCWMIADNKRSGALYGFPYLNGEKSGEPRGMKFAWHHPAQETDPDHVNRKISVHEIQELITWVGEYIPAVTTASIMTAKTCLYANSADENFIIDHLPGYDKDVTIACGFSGHGFKFVSVVGEILADLVMTGETKLPIDFLNFKRFNN